MKCEACREEFIHSNKEEDLCPECEDALKEGATEILLLPEEAAIVFRKDGPVEFYMSEDDPTRTCSSQELLAAAIVIRMSQEKKFADECLDFYEKTLP